MSHWRSVTRTLRKVCVASCLSYNATRLYSSAVARDSKFSSVTPHILRDMASVLATPQTSLLSTMKSENNEWGCVEPSEFESYNVDWMGKYKGKSTCVVRPKTTEEVAAIMRICNQNNLAVVPQGGNTGLVGGSVPVHDEVIVSLARMNKIRSFDPVMGTLVCDAGCIPVSYTHLTLPTILLV